MAQKTTFKISIGERIKHLRKQQNMTQKEFGEKIGIGLTTVSNYEVGYSQPDNETLTKISKLFNVSIDYLLGNTSLTNPKEYLENILCKYNLAEDEYDLVVSNILENNTIDLSILNSSNETMNKIQKAYCEIFNVYINYLEANPLDSINNINNENDIKEYIKPIDNNFIQMIKTLDKNKIIHQLDCNVFPTIDIPKKYPVLGKISAGLPILAIENIEDYSYAPSSKIQEGYDYFFLRVQGDSMNNEFPDGCLLLVQRQPTLEKGQIGVFRINGDDATVKRFKEENGLIMLEPRSTNPVHETQTYDPKQVKVEIIGKVISYI